MYEFTFTKYICTLFSTDVVVTLSIGTITEKLSLVITYHLLFPGGGIYYSMHVL